MNKVKVALGTIGVSTLIAAIVYWSLQRFLEALQNIPVI